MTVVDRAGNVNAELFDERDLYHRLWTVAWLSMVGRGVLLPVVGCCLCYVALCCFCCVRSCRLSCVLISCLLGAWMASGGVGRRGREAGWGR
jgi:hypothetical protein